MAQREDTPDFRWRVANPTVRISWLSEGSLQCPHFICFYCSRPITIEAPGIVEWRYVESKDDGDYENSIDWRVRHKGQRCDPVSERRSDFFWFWDDLEDVLDYLLHNTLGRKPPANSRFATRNPEMYQHPMTKKGPSAPASPRARKPIPGSVNRYEGPPGVRCQHWFEKIQHPNATWDEDQCSKSATHVRWDSEGIDGTPLCAEHAGVNKNAKKNGRSTISPSQRWRILRRDNWSCKKCGRSAEDGVKLHVDHMQPVSKGGGSEDENLWTLCEPCNNGKSNELS